MPPKHQETGQCYDIYVAFSSFGLLCVIVGGAEVLQSAGAEEVPGAGTGTGGGIRGDLRDERTEI